MEFLASEVELSPAHFARAFRETFGLPPHRYLLHLRLERARRMLDAENAVLSDVALRGSGALHTILQAGVRRDTRNRVAKPPPDVARPEIA